MKLDIISLNKKTAYSCITMKLDGVYEISNCFKGDTKLSEIVNYFNQQMSKHNATNQKTKQ